MTQADFSRINRVLIIKLRHHGDVLLTSPLPTLLKTYHPHIETDVLVYADTRFLLEQHPAIAQIHVIDRSWKKRGLLYQLRAEMELLQTLRRRHYDLVLHLTESWRGALLARWIRPPLAIVADYVRRRHSRYWRNSFSHHYPVPGRLRHTVEKHIDALRVLGLHPKTEERRLFLGISAPARQKIQSLLSEHPWASQGFILIHPTSRWSFKSWNPEKTARVMETLLLQGHRVILSASPDPEEMAMINTIVGYSSHPPSLNLAGRLSLDELAALIERSQLFFGMDSAPMHMAAALNIPSVVLFGPSGDREWGPWMPDERHRVITADPEHFPCRPCGLAGCADSQIADCLETIPVPRVLQAIQEMLSCPALP